MLIFLLLNVLVIMILCKIASMIGSILYKLKISRLLESVNSKEDLLYMPFRDFLSLVEEVFKRRGFQVKETDRCGEGGNGLILNNIQYVEVWKHAIHWDMEIEAAMKLANCMKNHGIYRGMLVTLGGFKQMTRRFCHTNVIECINGDQLLSLCKSVQKKKELLQTS